MKLINVNTNKPSETETTNTGERWCPYLLARKEKPDACRKSAWETGNKKTGDRIIKIMEKVRKLSKTESNQDDQKNLKDKRMKILETERLILETIEQERFEDLAELLANAKVHKFFPKTLNKQESREFLNEIQKRQNQDGLSFWAVIRKKDKRFLGICGLFKQNIDNIDEIEVGYRINDEFWGNGYGTEAAKGCITYAKNILGLSSVISLILKDNKQSIRVAEKNGLILEKETMFHDKIHQVYRIRFK